MGSLGDVEVEECSDEEIEMEEKEEQEDEDLKELKERGEQEQAAIEQKNQKILSQLNGDLSRKVEILEAFKQTQMAMQTDLVNLMKEQYHQKIIELSNEMRVLED